jgi:geranylgeranyl reductase family protein
MLDVKRFDVIVVGAGPAGSVTAYRLARAGASVLLVDRARFPRDKPCGGGLTGRALRQLPFSVDPVVEDIVDRFEFRLRYGRRVVRRGRGELVQMTQRRRLDAFLAERAAEAGAEFRDGVRITAVDSANGGVVVDGGGDRMLGDVLVGADGVNGVTARALGLRGRHVYGVALEGNVPYRAVPEERYRGRAVLELGIVSGGYGWVFAKGDHVNVGVGGWEVEGPRLRSLLDRLCVEHGIPLEAVADVRGFRLPLRGPGDPAVSGRALVVGDAAGLVDPISGDGMYEAFVSARLAADAVDDLLSGRAGTLEPYPARLDAALDRDAQASWAAKLAFDRFPRLAFGFILAPRVWTFVDQLIRGEIEHVREARGIVRVPLRGLERLGKTAAAGRYTSPSKAA